MTEAFRTYLLSIVAVSLLTSLLLALVPKGGARRTLSLACGLLLLLTAIGPVASIDFDALSQAISRSRLSPPETAQGQTQSEELLATIIKEKAEAYILDKAASLGASITATVQVQTGEGYPYPHSVTISGHCSRRQKTQLGRVLEADLAIPAQRQEWNTDE